MKTAGLVQPWPGEPATLRSRLASPRLSAGHLLTPSTGLQATVRHTGPSLQNRLETQGQSPLLENRLLRCTAGLSRGPPLRFSQALSPKLPRTLCTLTCPSPSLLCPLTSSSLKTQTEKPSAGPGYDRQQEARIEDSINKEQWESEDPTETPDILPGYNLSAEKYEDLEQARGTLIDEELRDVPDPSQNQDTKLQRKKEALLNAVCCSLIRGAKFTDAHNQARQELLTLCQDIAAQDPEFVLKVTLYTRQELNIRSTANFLLALGAWLPPCRPHLRRYFCQAVQLPSDWIEVAKFYQSLAEGNRKVAPYPSCLRSSLADSFKLFDEYQLAKYNTRRQRGKSDSRRLRQVAESSPAQMKNKPKDHFSLKKLVRWLHLKEPTYHIMCLLGRRYPSDLQSFSCSRLPGPWDSRRAGKRMKFQSPETWERQLSLRGNTVKVWEELIDNQKLPFMAMLRNLRNVIAAGISSQHHKQILDRLTDKNSVIRSRQFPFRFLAAYKVLAELQERLDQKDEPLPTKEALVRKALESTRLPRRRGFLRGRASALAAQRRVQGISFIHQSVNRKLEQLKKNRVVRYDQGLLERYQAALTAAVEISASHNVAPLPGHTVILCCVDHDMRESCVSANSLHVPVGKAEDEDRGGAKSPQMLDVAILLALMVKHVSEHSRLILHNSNTYHEVEISPGSILGNVDHVLQEAQRLQDAEICDTFTVPGVVAFLMDCVQNHVQMDTLLQLGGYYQYHCSSALQLYRYHVNLDLLQVHVNLAAIQPCVQDDNTGCKNDVFLAGYSDQILRFVCERGSSRLLEHVDRIDEIFRLPRAREGGRSPKVVETAALGPLLLTPKLRWRTVRVFVSSTFRDMRSERDLLVRSVFPELRARAARHFVRVQEVDLRWGITEEESRSNRQLELCLTEVTRCQLFVGILGERYGQMLQEYSLPNLPQFEWVKSYPGCRSITELEIMQFLRLNEDPSNRRSFFYTRDPAALRSLPEQWIPDFAAESVEAKARVADLKSHVKEAGLLVLENYQSEWGGEVKGKPYLKGLEEFGVSVLNTLWKAIVSQYCQADCEWTVEGSAEEEDTLQEAFQEEQGCQRFGRLRQLSATTAAIRERREGGLFVLHGRPSEGKTAFMASLVSQLALRDQEKRPGPTDLLFHFTAASEGARDGARMLQRLCRQLADRLERQQDVPQSYRGLVLVFHSLLDRFAHSQPRRHLVLMIDGADCVQTGNEQRTSDWIPEHVPRRVTLVLSVTEDSPLHRALSRRRESVSIRLGALEPLDRSEIVRRRLALYGKKLEESAFNNQMRQLVTKKESHNPLFLRLASEELREFGVFEKVSDQIRALPATLRLLIQHALGCLEEGHGVEMVTLALSALSTSGKGLRERDLYSILCTNRGLRAGDPPLRWEEVMEETQKPSRPVPMATFVRLMRSLRCVMGVWTPAERLSSRLRLPTALLQDAVQQRYLRDSEQERRLHLLLAVHLWRLTDPEGNGTFTACDPETLSDLPHHLILSGETTRFGSLLTNLRFSSLHVRLGMLPQLCATFNLYHAESQGALSEVSPYRDFVFANTPVLSRDPILFWQQALNQPDGSPVCAQARRLLLANGGGPGQPSEKVLGSFRLIEWTNKPQAAARTEGKVMTTPTVPSCASVSPSGRLAVVGTSEGYLHVLDLESGQELRSLASSCDGISDCKFLGETALCVTAFNGKIEAWSLTDGCRLLLIEGHSDRITGCTLNPDSKHLATCSWDRTVKVWVVTPGKLNVTLTNPHPLNCVTFHPDGQLLATGSWDRTVRVWNWVTARVVRVLQGHPASVRAVAYTPSGDYLASASLLGDVRLWSAPSGSPAGSYQAHRGPVTALRYLAGGKCLLTTGEDHQVRVWSGTLGRRCGEYVTQDPSPALCVSVSESGALMAVGYHSNRLKVFHLETGSLAVECEDLKVPVRCLQWLDSEEILASGSDDHVLRVWRLQDSRASCVRRCRGHTRPLVSLSRSERFLASASGDFTVLLWTLAELIDREGSEEVSPACVLRGHSDSVTCSAFSPDGLHLVTGSKDKSLLFWDLEELPARISRSFLSCHQDWITGCAWAPRYVASCSNDGTVCLWDPISGNRIKEFKGPSAAVSGVCVWADLILSVTGTGDLVVWRESGGAVTTIHAHSDRINHLASFNKASPAMAAECDGEEVACRLRVATASDDGKVRLWQPLLAGEVATLSGHSAPVSGAAAAADSSSYFLTVAADQTVRLWDLPHQQGVEHSACHRGAVTSLCWSPSGEFLVSGSRSGEVKVWRGRVASHTVQAHNNQISAVVFFSDREFAVGSFDKRVSIWALRPQHDSVRMCLQTSFDLDSPVYYMTMLRMRERLLVGNLRGNLFIWSPEEGIRTLMESINCSFIFSRVIERPDGSLLAVDSPRRVTILTLTKFSRPPSEVGEGEESGQESKVDQDTESGERDEEMDQDTEQIAEPGERDEEMDRDTERIAEPGERDEETDQDTESETWDAGLERDAGSEKREAGPQQDEELLNVSHSDSVVPWGWHNPEAIDTSVWLTVVRESSTTLGGARMLLCADSRGSLWCSEWDPTAVPKDESSQQCYQPPTTWKHKRAHSDRVTAVSDTTDLLVTASWDRTVRLWDRKSMKQVGLFTCEAAVLCLEVNPVDPGVGVCGDSSGNLYFLKWSSRILDG